MCGRLQQRLAAWLTLALLVLAPAAQLRAHRATPSRNAGLAVTTAALDGAAQQLTDNDGDDGWDGRHSTTSRGKVLWTNSGDVLLHDGTSVRTVQLLGNLGNVDTVVFGLGSGSSAGQVIGAWRRGTDDAYVSINGNAPVKVTATNPIDADEPTNPEGVAIADGCVFMILQAFSGGNAVKHVFRINPVTGATTNLTGNAPVPGAARITTSRCRAAWVFDDGSGTEKLHFYNGTVVRVADTGSLGFRPHLKDGMLVYEKVVSGVRQIFLYDSTRANPTAVQLTRSSSGGNFFPQTDGQHVAWLRGSANGTNLQIILNGGVQLTDAATQPADITNANEFPLQLDRGQVMWQDRSGALRYRPVGTIETVAIAPATTFEDPWLNDGGIAWHGKGGDGQDDTEVFRFAGPVPVDAQRPAPPLLVTATPRDRRVTVAWDRVLGAASYNLYLAERPGVTKDNYQTLPGGRKISGVTSPVNVTGLRNFTTYFFAVTSVAGATEGPSSAVVSATPVPAWKPVGGLAAFPFYAAEAHKTNPSIVYAAGAGTVFKSTDGGSTWSSSAGGPSGRDIRALAVDGVRVYAATRDGDMLRSINAGGTWKTVADGEDIGEQRKSLAIAPSSTTTLYAGDFRLPSKADGHSYVIRSTNGGTSWAHRPEIAIPGGEIHAYAIAVHPTAAGTLYAGGTGTPSLVKSTNGGSTWSDVGLPVPNYVYALAINPVQPATIYAGTRDNGIYRSLNGGASWARKNTGLPTGLGAINVLVVDPADPRIVYAGTDNGVYRSGNGGNSWVPLNNALTTAGRTVNSLALTPERHLIAATRAGLFLVNVSQ